jgi:predicted GNAT superfamily acetyltransferase
MLLAVAHNGGLVIGAYAAAEPGQEQAGEDESDNEVELPAPFVPSGVTPAASLAGFVFGFPGFYETPDGPRTKHCSHMLGVHPDHRNRGVGFALKRAQWQMIRHQGIDRITWTYDPLLSRNAHLNIARLGGVCNTYLQDEYGEMHDELNAGIASDRFQVDWWVNSQRTRRRLSKKPRLQLDLAHFLSAGAEIVNPTHPGENGFPKPVDPVSLPVEDPSSPHSREAAVLLLEIPPDFQALRAGDPALAQAWRLHTRSLFAALFQSGYLVTDFVYLPGQQSRSFYVLSHGESTL